MSAGNSKAQRKAPGRPFEPGKSGNPGGLSHETRERRQRVSEALEKAFVDEATGEDKLITAIKLGVAEGEPQLIKLACEYRWGKAVQPVEIAPESMDNDALKGALIEIAEQWKSEGGGSSPLQ